MNKRKVRVYVAFADAGGIYNNEVLFTSADGYRSQLAICIGCGDLFAMDLENPATSGLTLEQIAGAKTCPDCGAALSVTLRSYPETFVGEKGFLGSYIPATYIPPDSESKVVEIWEMIPD
jgi:hypothetical protein